MHSRTLRLVLWAGLTLPVGLSATGHTSEGQPNFGPILNAGLATGPIVIDGELNDPGWQNAARADGFVEVNPGDNAEPAVRSEALITYDKSHLYIALIAYDDPAEIRVSMSDRDAIFRDDYFGVLIDTYGELAWGYEIFVNPIGIQGDLRTLSDGSEDIALDLVFESRGIVTSTGYQVELAIPFASLRFPDSEEQVWRINFWRDRQRDNRYKYSWAAQDRDNDCWQCQWGTLTGIRNVKPSSNLDILPNIIGYQSGSVADPANPDSDFSGSDPDAELALNVRYGLSTNSSLELTVNPDFSQVESDAGRIDVNETHALFFPERRPFFQEGSDLYRSYYNIIHTRTINDPIVAAKFTGQFGPYSIAYLAARDDNSPVSIPLRERSITGLAFENSTSNILRARRTFAQDSYIGLILTDRRTDSFNDGAVGKGSGTVVALDGRYRLNPNYSLDFGAYASHTAEPDAPDLIDVDGETFDYGAHTVALDGESFGGSAFYARLRRGGRVLNCNLDYQERSPTFRADNGIIFGNDMRNLNFSTNLQFRPNKEWLVSWRPELNLGRVYSHRATMNLNPGTFNSGTRDEWFRPGLSFELKGQTNISVAYLASREWFQGYLFTGISRGFLNFSTRPSSDWEIGGNFEYGKKVVRFLTPPVFGLLTNLSLWWNNQMSQRLLLSYSIDYQQMDHRDHYLRGRPGEDKNIYKVFIGRVRLNYQFSREWYLRLIIENSKYGDFDIPNQLRVEPLLTYRINPFTMFYVGASFGSHHYLEGYDYEQAPGTWRRQKQDRWRLTDSQLFAKFQYLFRI